MGTQWKTHENTKLCGQSGPSPCLIQIIEVKAQNLRNSSAQRGLASLWSEERSLRKYSTLNLHPHYEPPLQPEPPRRRGTIENAHPSVSTHPDKGHLKMFAAMSRHVQTTSYHVISISTDGERASQPRLVTGMVSYAAMLSTSFNFQPSYNWWARTWWQARPSCTSMCFRASERKNMQKIAKVRGQIGQIDARSSLFCLVRPR